MDAMLQTDGIMLISGSVSSDKSLLRPKICPRCDESNKPDSKFCASCKYELSFESFFNEAIEQREKATKVVVVAEETKRLKEDLEQTKKQMADMGEQLANIGVYLDKMGKQTEEKERFAQQQEKGLDDIERMLDDVTRLRIIAQQQQQQQKQQQKKQN